MEKLPSKEVSPRILAGREVKKEVNLDGLK
jgi:hypothetical protein